MAGEGDGGCSEGRNKASLKEAGSKKGWQEIPKRVRETSPEKEISSKLHFWGLIFSTVKAHMLCLCPSPLFITVEMPRGATVLWMMGEA